MTDLATTREAGERVAAASLAVILHEESEQPLSTLDVPANGEIVVVVGPRAASRTRN